MVFTASERIPWLYRSPGRCYYAAMTKRLIMLGMALGATVLVGACHAVDKAANADDSSCRSYGLTPGTKPYTQCRMVLAHERGAVFKGFEQGGFDQSITAGCNISTHVCQPDGTRGIPGP
jgi:hypothetical protein